MHTCSNRRAHLLPVDGCDKALDGVNQRVPFVGERRADGRPVGVFKDAVQPRSQPCAQCSPVRRAEEGVEHTEHKVQAIRNQLTEVCPVEAGHKAVQDKGNSVCPFYGKRLYRHNPVINCGHDAVQTASDNFADALPVTRFKGSFEGGEKVLHGFRKQTFNRHIFVQVARAAPAAPSASRIGGGSLVQFIKAVDRIFQFLRCSCRTAEAFGVLVGLFFGDRDRAFARQQSEESVQIGDCP